MNNESVDGRSRSGAIVTEWRFRRNRPDVVCCKPQWVPFPSGHAWAHSRYCGARDGRWIARRGQKIETPTDAHLLVGGRPATHAEALAHRIGCRCTTCGYRDAHMDDDDDDGRPWSDVETEGASYDRRAD